MKHIRRILSGMLALLLLVCSVPIQTVFASDADDAWYSQLFSVHSSAYYLVCQPDSAITLTDNVYLTPSMQSDNYKGGVVDLPRLQADYHYVLSTSNPDYLLPATLYPTLAWNTAAIGSDTVLYIANRDDEVVSSVNVSIDPAYTTMKGIDDTYKVVKTEVSADGTTTETETVEFIDASVNVVSALQSAGDTMRHYDTSANVITVYDHAMHKSSIVMTRYAYTPDVEFGRMTKYAQNFVYESFDKQAYEFTKIEGAEVTTSYDIKEYARSLNNGSRPGLLFYGSKTANCSFDNNTGLATTVTTIYDVDPIRYFIATEDRVYFSIIKGGCPQSELSEVVNGTPIMSWTVGKTYKLKSGSSWLEAGFTSNPDKNNPNYLNYGPVDMGSQFKYHLNTNFDKEYNADEVSVTPSHDYCKDCNYYALSLLYNAAIPHLGTCTMTEASYTVTLNYYYKTPTDDSWTLLTTKDYNAAQFANAKLETLPDLVNYKPDSWYIDTGFATPLNPTSFSKTQNKVLNVYGQYKYVNGYYSVIFVDDNKNTKTTKTFKVTEQPTLPETPKAPDGYSFANWMVVNSENSTSGVAYDSGTFVPAANAVYYFRATWATKGVISGVDVTKTEYYVGETIDKSTITVYVRSDDTGNVKKVATTELDFDSEVVRRVGDNAITITYKSTGYKYTFYLKGIERTVASIEAEYSGGKVKVGSTYNAGAFKVTATYNDKSTADVMDFSISPAVCAREGDNTVVITYLNVSTTCTVTGVKATEYEPEVPIDSLTASYKGKELNVGDKIKAKDITVVVSYVNGERITLSNSDFTFSPTTAEYSGDMRVTVTFKSVDGACIVPVKKETPAKPSIPDTPTSTPTPSGNNSNSSNNNNTHNPNANNNSNTGYIPSTDSNTSPYPSTDNTTPTPSTDTNTNTNTGTSNDVKDNTHTDKTAAGKGTSIGYLNGANILTNTLGVTADIELGSVTLLNLCKSAEDGQSIFVNLTNNRNGNTITTECLKLIKDKNLTIYVTMSDSAESYNTVASWMVLGNTLDKVDTAVDLNVMFDVTDKTGERLLYIAPSSAYYPMGMTLSVTPLQTYYGSGDLIHQYSCLPTYSDSKHIRAFAWGDNNYITYNLYEGRSICLSDSKYVYQDGMSLLDAPLDYDASNTTDGSTNDENMGNGGDSDEEVDNPFADVDWTQGTKLKSKSPVIFFIVVGAIVLIGAIIITVVVKAFRKPKRK